MDQNIARGPGPTAPAKGPFGPSAPFRGPVMLLPEIEREEATGRRLHLPAARSPFQRPQLEAVSSRLGHRPAACHPSRAAGRALGTLGAMRGLLLPHLGATEHVLRLAVPGPDVRLPVWQPACPLGRVARLRGPRGPCLRAASPRSSLDRQG
ncbi:hypothetical protein GCM10023083_28650 [Streptomyces phyllanthi]